MTRGNGTEGGEKGKGELGESRKTRRIVAERDGIEGSIIVPHGSKKRFFLFNCFLY